MNSTQTDNGAELQVPVNDSAELRDFGTKLMKHALLAFTAVSTVLLLAILIGLFFTLGNDESIDFVRVNKSIQLTMCMICGLLFAFFGVALSWAGIKGSFNGSIATGSISAAINTASPGIVLMICGTILIALPVTMDVRTKTIRPASNNSAESQVADRIVAEMMQALNVKKPQGATPEGTNTANAEEFRALLINALANENMESLIVDELAKKGWEIEEGEQEE